MFDVGFSELVLIALLALILLGPQRLPEVARAAGKWMARLRNFISNVKQDLDREMRSSELDELRRLKQELDDTRRVIQESSGKLLQGVSGDLNAVASEVSSIGASVTSTPSDTTPTTPPAERPPLSKPKAKVAARTRSRAPVKKKHGKKKKARKPASR